MFDRTRGLADIQKADKHEETPLRYRSRIHKTVPLPRRQQVPRYCHWSLFRCLEPISLALHNQCGVSQTSWHATKVPGVMI